MSQTEKNFEYVIMPPSGISPIDIAEIWEYRELLFIFIWRDIKVRYKQTLIGIAWAVFQPLLTMVIFTIFFGNLAKIPSDGIPYPVFVYSGLLLWIYFSSAINNTSICLINNEALIKKIYFPRLILPLSSTVTPIVDFLFSFVIFLVLMFMYQMIPGLTGILLIPVLLLISFLTASGLGMFLASVNVKYRDVRYILPFFIQLLLFLTPVIYPVSIIPENLRWISYLNPMSGVITIARSSLLNTDPVSYGLLVVTFLVSVVFFLFGILFFKKTERFFADTL